MERNRNCFDVVLFKIVFYIKSEMFFFFFQENKKKRNSTSKVGVEYDNTPVMLTSPPAD